MNNIDMNSGEKLTYSGCYAMSEDEFEKEIKNFVSKDDGSSLTFDIILEKDGLQLCIKYDRGHDPETADDYQSGYISTMYNENFFVLSKEEVCSFDDMQLEFDSDECSDQELEAIRAKGFKSLVNIDHVCWRERFESELL